MMRLLLHPKTREQLGEIIQHQPHALILSGAPGSGKKTIALSTASQILHQQNLAQYPYFLQIVPENHTIGIESVRRIKAFLDRKTTGIASIRRVVIISDAHTMTIEAQNALLKVLEEPPPDTMLLLTTTDLTAFKPTIISRAQHLSILPITMQAALDALLGPDHDQQAITAAYYMSGGRAGLLIALLEQKADHELTDAIKHAKEFLLMSPYERLLQTDTISKQKDQLSLLLEGLQRIVTSGLEQAALKSSQAQVKKFHILSIHLQQAKDALNKNANTKLVLSNLYLQM